VRLGILASGSRGNAFLVEHEDCVILIDAGLSCRKHTERSESAGFTGAVPDILLLSHEHTDHVSGAGVVARRWRIPVYGTEGTLTGASRRFGKLPAGTGVLANGSRMKHGPFVIEAFSVAHDAADPSGFVIECSGGRIGIATDLGCPGPLVRESLSGCSALVLEFNHDEDMLWNGSYPWHLKQRIASSTGHLSNEVAASLLDSVLHPGLKLCVLAHLSQENNLPDLAVRASREAAGESVMIWAGKQDSALPAIEI